MRKEGLENLSLTGYFKSKRYGGQHNLPNELVIIVSRTMIRRDRKKILNLLKATSDRKSRIPMIAFVLKRRGTQIRNLSNEFNRTCVMNVCNTINTALDKTDYYRRRRCRKMLLKLRNKETYFKIEQANNNTVHIFREIQYVHMVI